MVESDNYNPFQNLIFFDRHEEMGREKSKEGGEIK